MEAPTATELGRVSADRLQALLDIARVIGATRRFDDLLRVTAEAARRALGGVAASISRWEREAGVLRTLVNVGQLGPGERPAPDNEIHPVTDWPKAIGLVDEGRGYVVSVADPPGPERSLLEAQGRGSGLSVAIHVEGRVWGELFVSRSRDDPPFGEADLDFAQAVAVQVAAGVLQADHYARIERLAYQDPLTQLANRRAVDDRLEVLVDEHRRTGRPIGLVLADINRLKHVNDSRGHDAGDRMLCAVADAVSRAAAEVPGSLAGRIGGDEFCVVVAGSGEQARAVGERLCELVDSLPMSTGVSCGVAATDWTPTEVDSPLPLFRLADAAQYRAKRSGLREPALARTPDVEPPVEDGTDRRVLRGRTSVDVAAVLELGVEVLDRVGPAGEQPRLEAVAEHLARATDAAAWWLSAVPAGQRALRAVATSIYRDPGPLDVAEPDVFDLNAYPLSAQAMETGAAFVVERGAAGNDPAEEDALVAAGYDAVLGAGGLGRTTGWLVEVYADPISLPLRGLEPAARALVALALTGAATGAPASPRTGGRAVAGR